MLFLFIVLQAFLKNKKERGKLLSIFINIELFYCHNRIETQIRKQTPKVSASLFSLKNQ